MKNIVVLLKLLTERLPPKAGSHSISLAPGNKLRVSLAVHGGAERYLLDEHDFRKSATEVCDDIMAQHKTYWTTRG